MPFATDADLARGLLARHPEAQTELSTRFGDLLAKDSLRFSRELGPTRCEDTAYDFVTTAAVEEPERYFSKVASGETRLENALYRGLRSRLLDEVRRKRREDAAVRRPERRSPPTQTTGSPSEGDRIQRLQKWRLRLNDDSRFAFLLFNERCWELNGVEAQQEPDVLGRICQNVAEGCPWEPEWEPLFLEKAKGMTLEKGWAALVERLRQLPPRTKVTDEHSAATLGIRRNTLQSRRRNLRSTLLGTSNRGQQD